MDTKLIEAIHILEQYNGIFRQFFELGTINFTDTIPRAAVSFNKDNNDMMLNFNPEFYDSINSEQLAFVLAHECMHPLLFHGRRYFQDTKYLLNPELFNVAADVCLHEIMFREFGFPDPNLDMCTLESVFKDDNTVLQCQTLSYYFDKIADECKQNGNVQYVELDTHNFQDGDYSEMNEVIKKAIDRLSDIEKQELKNKISEKVCKENTPPGDDTNSDWHKIVYAPLRGKRKWELAIKEWVHGFLMGQRYDWSRPARRLSGVDGEMILPSPLEPEDVKRRKVWVFMDTSGSCIELASRFFSAAASLPKNIFDVRLFCFDTEIYPTTLQAKEVQGGGGTMFSNIPAYIAKQSSQPEFVFMITDGEGDIMNIPNPTRWHIYLTGNNKSCFPEGCHFYSFEEFE